MIFFFYLSAIPNADTEERRIAANTRSPAGSSHIGFYELLMLLKRSQMDITQLLFCRVVIECGFTPGRLIYFQVVDRTSSQQLTFNSPPTEYARVPMGASNCHSEQFPNQILWSMYFFLSCPTAIFINLLLIPDSSSEMLHNPLTTKSNNSDS